MTQDLADLQAQINRYGFQGHTYSINNAPIEPYLGPASVHRAAHLVLDGWKVSQHRPKQRMMRDHDGVHWYAGPPDITVVKEIAARHCPATPEQSSRPLTRGDLGGAAEDCVRWQSHPGDYFADTLQRLWREQEERWTQERIDALLAQRDVEHSILWDLITPRFSGKERA